MFHLHLVISPAVISRWGLHIPTAISSFVNSSLFVEKRRTHGFCACTLLIRLAPGFFQWLISQLKQSCHNLVDTLFSLLVSSTCWCCVSWALSAMAKSHLLIIQSVPHSQSAGLWQSYQPHPVSRRPDGEHSAQHSTAQHSTVQQKLRFIFQRSFRSPSTPITGFPLNFISTCVYKWPDWFVLAWWQQGSKHREQGCRWPARS